MAKYYRDITITKGKTGMWTTIELDKDKKEDNRLLDAILNICNEERYKYSYFRGQNNPHPPVAGIFRSDYAHILDNELEYYSTIIADHSSELVGITEVIDFFSLLQHYGCPTRLLDITKNPLIAMQFMISGEIHADGHTFYIFESQNESINYKSLGQITDIENFSKECNFPILRAGNSYNKNRRIETQKGLFIYFDEKNSHNNNIDNLLIKYKVTRIGVMFNENGDSDEIKRDLEKYHYYNYNLYPDLVSKADYYKFEWKKGVVDKEL